MKCKLVFVWSLSLVLGISVSAQTGIRDVISNGRTDRHVFIAGTRLALVPPEGFTPARSFTGLQKDEITGINVLDLPGTSYNDRSATFRRTDFEGQGMQVLEFRNLRVDRFPARFVRLKSNDGFEVMELIFGDSSFSTLVMAVYPGSDVLTGRSLTDCFNSIHYEKSRKVDPFELAVFSVDTTQFGFRRYLGNVYFYEEKGLGAEKADAGEEAVLLVSQFPLERTMKPEDIATKMMAKAQQNGLAGLAVKNISTEPLNGYDAFEAEVSGSMNARSAVIYLCVLCKDDMVVVVQGTAQRDIPRQTEAFRNFAHSLRFVR